MHGIASSASAQGLHATGVKELLAGLLEGQQALSAVDRFARWHVHPRTSPDPRLPSPPPYRRLLPASPPGPGQQYAFEVDLDLCSGCKACVTACHSLNGLEPAESWRSVGLLIPSPRREAPSPGAGALATLPVPGPRHITTACHHCADPACLHGCPVLAYDKDPRTGIVRHLDDQCIGCSYCTMMCPYEVPRYSPRLGIVRKCDLCQGRLAAGEPPACAQACPNDAIRIGVVATEGPDPVFPPDSPDPLLTRPTTRYLSSAPLSGDLVSASTGLLEPAPAHRPLVVMLVLTQLATGTALAETSLPMGHANATKLALATVLLAGSGLIASTAHLGRPLRAWSAFLGWRRSWLSREILAFGAFLPLALLHAAASLDWLPWSRSTLTGGMTFLAGTAGVATSCMVYIATRRRFWDAPATAGRFLGTLALGALAALALAVPESRPVSWLALAVLLLCKTAYELGILNTAAARASRELDRSRRLMATALRPLARTRTALGLSAATAALAAAAGLPGAGALAATLAVSAELAERSLFFRAVSPDRMPGVA